MRWRLVAVLVVFTALVLGIQMVPLANYITTVAQSKFLSTYQSSAFALAGYAIPSLLPPGSPGAPTPADQTKLRQELQDRVSEMSVATSSVLVVVDQDGTVVAHTDPSRIGEDFVTNRPEIAMALAGQDPKSGGERSSETLGQTLYYFAVPVRYGSTVIGAVRLSYPASQVEDSISSTVHGIELAALITLVCAGLIALLVASYATDRIRRLRDAAELIAEGDLTARAAVAGGGELEELATSFNTMAERVQGVVDSQRGFAGDASHQLRTPLTALRLRLESAAEQIPPDAAATVQLDAARDEIDRLQRLIDGLLVLARADNRDQQTVPVDITAVAADRVEAWQALADERSVRIELDAPGMAVAQVVPSAAEQIIDNYVDNALGVVPEGSRIIVSVRSEPGGVLIFVDDEGPGLPPEDRERAFDRFWRGTQDGQGSGLGLAVVASLAQAGGGSVWLAESPLGGLRAAARLRSGAPVERNGVRRRGEAVRGRHF
ncbi:MAG: HAMP domain-containing protein [Frankiales bacterium]|nr:HAMP domain-containing protein [Frankiales bacterium]